MAWLRESFLAEKIISVLKYLLAVFVMVVGVSQCFVQVEPMSGPLGFLYSSRIFIVAIGVTVFASGLTLLVGKIRKHKKMVGRGLFGIYATFLFAALCQGVQFAWAPEAFVPNLIFALFTALLWLRWKFKTEYIDPKHFRQYRTGL